MMFQEVEESSRYPRTAQEVLVPCTFQFVVVFEGCYISFIEVVLTFVACNCSKVQLKIHISAELFSKHRKVMFKIMTKGLYG